MTIYVGKPSYRATQRRLQIVFAEYGAVKRIVLPTDRENRSCVVLPLLKCGQKMPEEDAAITN